MEYTWYILGYTMYIHQTGYTWYILGYTKYIHGISMDIHGISFDVYTWYIRGISWYIHGYSELSETRFRRRPVLLVSESFNVHKRVGDQECFIPRATMAIAPGVKAAHKSSTRLPPTVSACRWWRR
jgi:hypothetical protein